VVEKYGRDVAYDTTSYWLTQIYLVPLEQMRTCRWQVGPIYSSVHSTKAHKTRTHPLIIIKVLTMPLTSDEFERLADEVFLRRSPALRVRMKNTRFRAGLGVSPYVCSWYWNQLEKEDLLPPGFKPKHFIWTLLFLKLYCSESVHATLCGCDEKTFRKWTWLGVKALGHLEVVSVGILCKCRTPMRILSNCTLLICCTRRLSGKIEQEMITVLLVEKHLMGLIFVPANPCRLTGNGFCTSSRAQAYNMK